jgi:hypothetical protein
VIASELKVYRDTYELTKLILEVEKQFPKLAKYTIGQRAIDTSLMMLDLIQMINMSEARERQTYFLRFIMNAEKLKILMRLAVEEKIISITKQSQIAILQNSIGMQISGWKKSQN